MKCKINIQGPYHSIESIPWHQIILKKNIKHHYFDDNKAAVSSVIMCSRKI